MVDNSAYVNARLKMLGISRLTEKQKDEFTKKKEEYLVKKESLDKKISELGHELSSLNKELKNIVPVIERAEYIHGGTYGCGLKAVFHIGSDNEGMEEVYYCAYCDKDFTDSRFFNAAGFNKAIKD
jgi:hypothetical protein